MIARDATFEASPARMAPAAPMPKALRVLVADDNAVSQLLLAKLLHKLGHAAEVVDSGRAALEAFSRGPFDVVLMDAQMPEMDGLEATREIRQREAQLGQPPVPVVALSADMAAADIQNYFHAGMNDVLGKPVTLAALSLKLAKYAQPR